MASKTRAAMIEAAIRILAEDGYQATSFSEVLARSGAPRGSIYHHFPGGKDELVTAALDTHIARTFERLESLEGRPPEAIVTAFSNGWRQALIATRFTVGCSLVAVTTSAGAGELRDKAGTMFRDWRALLARLIEAGGATPAQSVAFAAQLLASLEGAVAMARAEGAIDVFDLVADQLRAAALVLPRREPQ